MKTCLDKIALAVVRNITKSRPPAYFTRWKRTSQQLKIALENKAILNVQIKSTWIIRNLLSFSLATSSYGFAHKTIKQSHLNELHLPFPNFT